MIRDNNPPFSWPFICLILLPLCTLMVYGECVGSQQSLLLQLKNSLNFASYSSRLVSWNESSDCCSWEGVTCEEGRVTHLDLYSEGITGVLDNSSILFNLQYLKSLDLSHNDFNSTIPSRIGSLSNLSYLNLGYAGFAGKVPIEISHLRSLVTLDLSSSDGESLEIPNLSILIQNHSKLQELHLNGANISAPGNKWCQALSSSLPNLRVLSLFKSHVPGPLDESLVELQSLSVIDLEGTNLSCPVPESFAKFSNLTLLSLRDCGLKGTFPSEIFQVPTLQILDISSNEVLEGALPEFQINNSLQELSLSSTKFSGLLPASLGNLRNLSKLVLSMCQFNGKFPSSISNLSKLVHVDLSGNNFSRPIPSFSLSTELKEIDLSNNSLGGEIPLHLFALSSLEIISLSNNQFSGPILDLVPILELKTSFSILDSLDLSHNNLEGLIPTSIFELGNLSFLDLSHNKFNGTEHQNMLLGRSNLQTLNLSCNSLRSFPYLENLTELRDLNLSYNNLKSIPDLKNLSMLRDLDLSNNSLKSFPGLQHPSYGLRKLIISNNQISGEIPKWISEVGNGSQGSPVCVSSRLCYSNFLPPFRMLDLHSNQLQGNIPVLPQSLVYLDLSSNNFTSLQFGNFDNLSEISFLSLSDNSLKGVIPDVFPRGCKLKALDLNGNFIEGEIPKSLANCLELELLDLGHNELVGEFPCLLKNISTLRVLILRSNKLYGSIECPNANGSWPMLQIFDAAQNNFSGELPRRWLTKLQGMVAEKNNAHLEVLHLDAIIKNIDSRIFSIASWPFIDEVHSEYTVTVTVKGLERELPKILDIFTSIDLSRNNFHGQIPEELGQLKALYILNLSYNALTGQIPSSIGNLRNLESLDLSWNNLSGTIPTQLQSLNFLQVLNLSFNQLVGKIPTGNQIQTFSEDSFIGNKGLCGFPLKNCSDKVAPGSLLPNARKDNHSNSGKKIDWNLLSAEIGLLTGFGAVVAPLVFTRRWRIWYYERVDDIIFKIFPLAVSRKWFMWTDI